MINQLVFICLLCSLIFTWMVSILISRKTLIYPMLVIGPFLLGLLISFIDPSNSFAIFILSSFINLLFVFLFYFLRFRKQVIEPEIEHAKMPEELEQKFQLFKKYFTFLLLATVVALLFFADFRFINVLLNLP